MSDLSTYLSNTLLNHALRNQAYTPPTAVYMSVHTADPGLTGTNEASGGSYARQAVTFAAASSKSVTSSATVTFSGMPGGTFTHVGLWDAASSGNFYAGAPAGNVLMYAAAQASTDQFTSYTHGLAAGDKVVVANDGGAGLPGGVVAGTIYYVISSGLTTDIFKISATSGGSAFDITTDGECIVRKVTSKTLDAGDVYEIASGQAVFTLY